MSGNRRQTLLIAADAFHNFMFRDLALASSGLRSLSFLEDLASVEVLDVGGNPVGAVQLSWSSGLALSCREARLAAINLTSVRDAQLSSFRSARRLDLSTNLISGKRPNSTAPVSSCDGATELVSVPSDKQACLCQTRVMSPLFYHVQSTITNRLILSVAHDRNGPTFHDNTTALHIAVQSFIYQLSLIHISEPTRPY